jgi:demethylmenaquinone methyltransferase/2-methoxy-6-polyprenyl-1,4-benzoquinol methylase
MASTYGYVNLVSSFGFTARWRRQVVDGLPLKSADRVVDLMSGRGELWHSLAKSIPTSSRVLGVDLSPEMARRVRRNWPFGVDILVHDVLDWDPDDASADVVVSSFGLKTLDREQQQRLAQVVAKLLRPGGVYSFIEISVPSIPPLRTAFLFYLKRVIPVIGRLFLRNPDCYRMLAVYTEAFGNTSHFTNCLRAAGLEAFAVSYFFGCATGVRGFKRQPPQREFAIAAV